MGYFDKFSHEGIKFMDNAEKGTFDEIRDSVVHIADFGFIKGKRGEFAVIKVAEMPGRFYFCNEIITDMLKTVQEDGMESELALQGIRFYQNTSKESGNLYWTFEFQK